MLQSNSIHNSVQFNSIDGFISIEKKVKITKITKITLFTISVCSLLCNPKYKLTIHSFIHSFYKLIFSFTEGSYKLKFILNIDDEYLMNY